MPIPTSDLQEQFKAPKVARGQAVDASKAVSDAYIPALNTIEQINKAGNSALKFAVAEKRATADYRGQNAFNEYIESMDALDLEFQKYTYEEAQKQLPNYYNKAKELHQKFINSIDNIDVTDIRENYRQQVNSFNIKQGQKTRAYVYAQKKEAEKEVYTKGKELYKKQAARSVSPYASGEDNYVTFNAALEEGKASIVKQAAENYWPKEMMQVEMQQWVGDTFKDAIANIVNGVDFNQPGNPYQNAIDFITAMRNQVPEDVWQNVAEQYEKESLNLEFGKHPDTFRLTNDPNQFNDKYAYKYAPHLSKYQRWKHLKDVSDGTAKNGGNIQKGPVAADLHNKILASAWQAYYESGHGGTDNWLIDKRNIGLNYSNSEDWKNRNTSFSSLLNARTALNDLLNGNFYVKGEVYYPASLATNEIKNDDSWEYINIAPMDESERKNITNTIFLMDNILTEKTASGDLDNSVYTSTAVKGVEPTFLQDVETFAYLINYEKNKEGFFRSFGRKLPFIKGWMDPVKPYNPDLMANITRALQGQVGQALYEINSARRAEAAKYMAQGNKNKAASYSDITMKDLEMPTVELYDYLNKLSKEQAIPQYDKEGNFIGNLNYAQKLIEESHVKALANAMPQETIEDFTSSIYSDSPSENYYDMNNSSAQTKQTTYIHDLYVRRQREIRNRKPSYGGLAGGGTSQINKYQSYWEEKKAKKVAEEKKRKSTFALEASVDKIFD